MTRFLTTVLLILTCFLTSLNLFAEEPETNRADVRIVVLGDSITKGVRTGVASEEIYQHLLEQRLSLPNRSVEILNEGIGGERTDQALKRLETTVLSKKPDIVTVMYGTNDSYVDPGKNRSRLTVEQYQSNLNAIVFKLQQAKIQVILMTEPRWGSPARNGIGENPNLKLEKFMTACREVAKENEIPLVDNYQLWLDAEQKGANLSDWTTDECHPNPLGHEKLTAAILPVLRPLVDQQKPAEKILRP